MSDLTEEEQAEVQAILGDHSRSADERIAEAFGRIFDALASRANDKEGAEA